MVHGNLKCQNDWKKNQKLKALCHVQCQRNMKKEFAKKSFVYKKPSTKRLLVSLILPRFSAP